MSSTATLQLSRAEIHVLLQSLRVRLQLCTEETDFGDHYYWTESQKESARRAESKLKLANRQIGGPK